MVRRVKDRLGWGEATFYSDGNDDYLFVLPEYFDDLDYGQVVKKRESGTIVSKEKRVLTGTPDVASIETYNVENFNSILRNFLSRLVRNGERIHEKSA